MFHRVSVTGNISRCVENGSHIPTRLSGFLKSESATQLGQNVDFIKVNGICFVF